MRRVDLENSDDVVFDEVLCVEGFEVDGLFSGLLALCGVAALLPVRSVGKFCLLQMFVSSRKFLRYSSSLTPVQLRAAQVLLNSVAL